MIDKRFLIIFITTCALFMISGYLGYRIFKLQRKVDQTTEQVAPGAYEDIDLIMPVEAFLKRGGASNNLSIVKKLFVGQWISSNQDDLIKLVVYAQGATSYEELKKAFLSGIEKEGKKSSAASFITNGLDIVDKDPALIEHINKSLKQGFSQEIHALRGQMMHKDIDMKEYKKLKQQYKKALDTWMDEEHGHLLDEIIADL